MNKAQIYSFGSWKSPITSDLIVAVTVGLSSVYLDREDIYWLESRPSEGGRNVIVRRTPDGEIRDVTPPPFNVRSTVHEYGGGAFIVSEETIYFSNFADRCLYKQKVNSEPQLLTEASARRYADFCIDKKRNRLICVCENPIQDDLEPENSLVSIDINSGDIQVLVKGGDFYASPCLNPTGDSLAFITWNHPNMPWDGTQLGIANISQDGSVDGVEYIAGGREESICEPKWAPDGALYFSSDRNGWWNIYRYNLDGGIEAIYPMQAEFGYPHWVFGESISGFVSPSRLICTYTQNGSWYLASLDTVNKQLTPIETNCTNISYLQVKGNNIVFVGGSPTQSTAVVKLDLDSGTEIVKKSSAMEIDEGYISSPQALAFPTEDGLIAYAWYYPPKNKDYIAPTGELPPLLVKSHGGPTAAAPSTFNLRIQYWTSRGFAYLDVNYGGSTGYGREYRQRLDKNWGIVDVDDCVNGAEYLVQQGKADPNRLAISGGSAGGYTTLAALTFRDTFKAGASYYGVSDLEVLAKDTHKFESRYLDRLIGKYPEEREIYYQRSPINFTELLARPVIFFQGLEDKVVPPNQAEMMVAAIRKKGLPVEYITFTGEQHGFRRAENIKKALDGEFEFYSRIFGFEKS
jgi:dipeptidyl aminopeptidase/acylaminoacyl peptidase